MDTNKKIRRLDKRFSYTELSSNNFILSQTLSSLMSADHQTVEFSFEGLNSHEEDIPLFLSNTSEE